MKVKLRLVRVVPVLDFGGVESGLVVHGRLHDRTAFDLRVCTFWKAGRAADAVRREGVPVDVLGVDPSIRNWRATGALFAYLRRVRPDVVHSSVPEADAHTALVAPLLRGTRVVLDEAGMPGRQGWKRLAFAAMNRSADAIVAVSGALKDYLVRSELVPPARIHVVPSCGDPLFFEAPKTDYSARSPFRLVTVGRLVEVKNKGVLIEAIARIRGVPVELVIIGDGPLRSELEARAAALGVASRVRVPGFVPNLADALREADAYALPSHSEGCSLSLIEAMAIGLPVVASAVPGNEEVLTGMSQSALVPPASVEGWARAIEKLALSSDSERAALGEQVRKIALERYSPSVYVNALEDLYRAVGNKRVGPS